MAMYSLFFPGAGHWYLGLKGAAIARGVLSSWVVFVAIAAGVAGSVLMASLFGLTAFILWAVAAHDAYREATNQPGAVILKGKMFVYLVIALLLLMIALLVAASFQVDR